MKAFILIISTITFLICLYLASVITGEVEGAELRQWQGIVIHHSATSPYTTVECIARYHINEKGWDAIGYHYLIDADGIIWGENAQKFTGMRKLDKVGAHAIGRNKTHISICLIGNSSFTAIQKDRIRVLCEVLAKQFPIKSIERHHEQCPGEGIDVEKLEKEVLIRGVK